jgi:cobalt/nickel transport system ATP-binding protein
MADLNQNLIEINGLNISFGERKIFDEMDFSFNAGERTGLVGANGSGKTTFLQTLVGLIKPQAGKLKIFGQLRQAEQDFTEVRRKIGFQFQDPDDQLFCPTVLEDIAFGPLNLGKSREETMAIVDKTLAEVGMSHFRDNVTHHLSQGEKKLVALGTILAMDPEILLLDEPTAGLDRNAEKRILEILQGLSQSMIIISHNEGFLDQLVSSRVSIKKGKMVTL